jgi:hypothetical protein
MRYGTNHKYKGYRFNVLECAEIEFEIIDHAHFTVLAVFSDKFTLIGMRINVLTLNRQNQLVEKSRKTLAEGGIASRVFDEESFNDRVRRVSEFRDIYRGPNKIKTLKRIKRRTRTIKDRYRLSFRADPDRGRSVERRPAFLALSLVILYRKT